MRTLAAAFTLLLLTLSLAAPHEARAQSSDCIPRSWTLEGNLIASGSYEAAEQVTARDATVEDGENVTLKAGESVRLEAGFKVEKGREATRGHRSEPAKPARFRQLREHVRRQQQRAHGCRGTNGLYEKAQTEKQKVAGKTDIPDKFALQQSYPNPMRSQAEIRFDAPVHYHDAALRSTGLPSGVYLYRFTAHGEEEAFHKTRRLVVAR